jgi:hypothetical protein
VQREVPYCLVGPMLVLVSPSRDEVVISLKCKYGFKNQLQGYPGFLVILDFIEISNQELAEPLRAKLKL